MDNNENNQPKTNGSTNEELASLISNAIENKKILDQADKGTDNQRISNTQSISRTASRPVVSNRPVQSSKPVSPNQNNQHGNGNRNNRPVQQNNSPKPDFNSNAPHKQNNTSNSTNHQKKKKGWSKKKKTGVTLGIIFLAFVIIIAIIVGLFFHYTGLLNRDKDTKINSGDAPLNSSDFVDESDTFNKEDKEAELKARLAGMSEKISDENVTNILLIGEDIRDTESQDRGNTDVMMIISINKENKTITMTSLMRDMYVYMSEYNSSGRINSAYWHGGCEYLEAVIEDYFGVEIDRYVKVDFYQFINVVEACGGIDMEVSEAEADGMQDPLDEQNKYIGNAHDTDYIDLSQFSTTDDKATLHLNGNQALAFARLRYVGNADFERTERQRRVITEVIKEAKNLSFLQLDALINKVFPNVQTDITDGEIASLLLDAFDYMNYDIQELRLPADGYYTNEVINNMAVLTPDFTANAALIQKMVYGDATTVEEAIDEYNQDLADGTATANNGYTVDNYNGYDNYNYGY